MATLDGMHFTRNLPLSGFVVALGLGLLIGAERERGKGSGADRGAAGVRTFALVGAWLDGFA